MEKNTVYVVAGLVRNNNTYLIAKRNKGDEGAEGKREFPGGKIEPNETKFEAIKREFKEEFALDIKPLKEIKNITYNYPTRNINITLIEAEVENLKIDMNQYDHSEYKWVSIEDFKNYDFALADKLFVEFLEKNI